MVLIALLTGLVALGGIVLFVVKGTADNDVFAARLAVANGTQSSVDLSTVVAQPERQAVEIRFNHAPSFRFVFETMVKVFLASLPIGAVVGIIWAILSAATR